MSSEFLQTLLTYGAQPSQLIELQGGSPRVLRYADLKNGDDGWSPPVVAEYEHVPRVFVFDGRLGEGEVSSTTVDQWCRRILLRGDPAWTAILRPGRLDVLSFDIRGMDVVTTTEQIVPGSGGLARFIHDVRSGAADLPRRAYLKDLLSESMRQAVNLGVSPVDAVSLVGWGLFWRFLVDRKLLVRKTPSSVAEGARTWTDCLSSKGRALKTLRWLDSTFNGGLLPFERSPKEFAPEVFSKVLGNIAAGATPQGQLRLPSDWDEIDFSHVPVGLLSEVYEAFATALDSDGAKRDSIHYTPKHIAEFVISEALGSMPDVDRPRVLDPAVGAGVFVIAAFRQLVQREWERAGERPKRSQIRRILSSQLSAFDVDKRALRLTQLGLYLTALELDPDPRPVESLRFDDLGSVLRIRDEIDGSLAQIPKSDAAQFDLVVGNPPWTGHDTTAKRRWVASTSDSIIGRLGEPRERFDLPDANPDLAFIWRAGEWAKPGGQIALVVHARWLFGISERMVKARSRIFTAFNVTGVLNGAALRHAGVWPNIAAPFCFVFARNEISPKGGMVQFVSPFVESRDVRAQAILRVDWVDAQAVPHDEVRSVPWALKSRFRGNVLARRAFASLRAAGLPLSEYLDDLKPGLQFRNGYQIGGKAGKQVPAVHMRGMPDLKGGTTEAFIVDALELPKFGSKTLLFPRDPAIYEPPLLLVRKMIPSDPLVPRAMRAELKVAFHESYHGLSLKGVKNGQYVSILLQILLQSKVGAFVSLMTDALYGVERETLYKESFDEFPVIPLDRLKVLQIKRMKNLSRRMNNEFTQDIFNELNEFVYDLYALSATERVAIDDTLDTRGPTPASVRRSVAVPTESEVGAFVSVLTDALNDVLDASDLKAEVVVWPERVSHWRVLSITTGSTSPKSFPLNELIREADESGVSFVVVSLSSSHVVLGLPDLYRYWTKTQAVIVAHDLLAGPLGNG